ncbi:nucleotidyltransferase [Longirhabdus pacifica]|uniref:nucleotidyltransferase n=1 Tax=Longirhabdus pacifica TaxID=2305227 RepID=UPI00100909B6|nr:nucleotidyltransferase [Longirhabdus pacifica]
MNTVGIIVEYNPLHNGHVHHFQQAKQTANADAVIAVMSGNFLQRGEPSIVNKWARTEMALHMGVDVVIELPVMFASQPAEWFAYGAVSALHATGVVQHLCFGSESGEIEWIKQLAKQLSQEPEKFKQKLQQTLKQGINYPQAYSQTVREFSMVNTPIAQLVQPNNTLGLHYCIALERLQSSINPLTIARTNADYNQQDITHQNIASATAIRKHMMNDIHSLKEVQDYMPHYTYDILKKEWEQGRAPMDWEQFAAPLFHILTVYSSYQLQEIYEVQEGLEHRLKQSLFQLEAPSVQHLLSKIKTKRYTLTKLQRMLVRILLQHSKEMINASTLAQGVPYLRILGFSEKGRTLLKQMKKTATVPVITNVDRTFSTIGQLDLQAAAAYALAYPEINQQDVKRDFIQAPLRR